MATEFDIVFNRLRKILQKHSGSFIVKPDTDAKYGLYAQAGPAALKAWGGIMKKPMMPLAWVETKKSYVSFHIMGLYGNTILINSMSEKLKARMQGKTCFNFKTCDEKLFTELEEITVRGIAGFIKAGFAI